jgi:hypothetical protein
MSVDVVAVNVEETGDTEDSRCSFASKLVAVGAGHLTHRGAQSGWCILHDSLSVLVSILECSDLPERE